MVTRGGLIGDIIGPPHPESCSDSPFPTVRKPTARNHGTPER